MAKSTTPRMTADDRRWRAESDMRTLTEAAKIQGDRTRMTAVKKVATDQIKTLSKVAGKPAARAKK
jgi:hypothetical protein